VIRLLALGAAVALAPMARAQSVPPPPPPSLLDVMGHYGSGLTEVVVYEDGGLLAAHTEGRTLRLRRTGSRSYAVSGGPPWVGDRLDFLPDSGRATTIHLGRYTLGRRLVGPADGQVFRIAPLRPVAEVLREARTARSPHGPGRQRPDLVDVQRLVPHVVLDVRYATPRNFMGVPLYPEARVILQRPAAQALARVQQDLARYGLGLVLYDGYRPWYVTKAFWDATPPEQRGFVANPGDGSKHNRGCAVDLGLVALQTGEIVEMPSAYDEFTSRAYADYPGGTSRARHFRDLLRRTMETHGFAVNPTEWWHFDFRGWRDYGVLNTPFEGVPVGR